MGVRDIPFNRRDLLYLIGASGALGLHHQTHDSPTEQSDDGPTEITECTTISSSGEYVLGSDIDATGDCFRIDASEVVLDGNGHVVEGDGNGTGLQWEDLGPITIRNLTIRGFETGLSGGLAGPTLENVTVEDNSGDGIELDYEGQISCSGCTFQRNGGAGLSAGWYSELELTDCELRANEGRALVTGTQSLRLDSCVAAGNGGPVVIPPGPQEMAVVDTEIRDSAGAGLRVIDTDAGWLEEALTVDNCTIRDNDGPGIEHESSFLEVRNSTITGNQDGYRGSYSQQWKTVLRDNTIEGNDGYGVTVENWLSDEPAPINGRWNYWGASNGPSSMTDPVADSVTGERADGDGDAIGESPGSGVASASFDPFKESPDDELPSVAARGATIQRGESGTIDVSALGVQRLTVEDLWADWEVVDADPAGGDVTNAIPEEGRYEIIWDERRADVTPSLTIAPPGDTYVGGTYGLTVTGTDGAADAVTSITLAIESDE